MTAHLREAWRARIQRTADRGTMYHLADKVDFRLDPNKHPANNTTWGGDMPEAGIFLGASVEAWVNGYGYWRPWVVEFAVPPDLKDLEGVTGGYSQEMFVPASHYDKLRMTRVVPLDAHCREEFGEWGWTEEFFETTFDTEEPISAADLGRYGLWRSYRYPGDARQTSPQWQAAYKKRVKRYARESGRGNGVYGV
jgi:hypothetical protein